MATRDLPRSAAHPFYVRLNQILDQHDFDGYAEGLCERFYAERRFSTRERLSIVRYDLPHIGVKRIAFTTGC